MKTVCARIPKLEWDEVNKIAKDMGISWPAAYQVRKRQSQIGFPWQR